jgi:hypothetical protein
LPRPKKVWRVRLNVKVMLTVFFTSLVHHEFLCQGQAVNHWYYLEVLKCLRENVRRKRPQLWRNNSWFLHHDSAPAHASRTQTQLCFLSHPSHLTWLQQTFSYFPN